MKVLIISPGYFPVTNQQGGAIEKLIDNFLEFSDNLDISIDVISPKISSESFDKNIYSNVNFILIDKTTILFKLFDFGFKIFNKIFIYLKKRQFINFYFFQSIRLLKKNDLYKLYDVIVFENGVEYIPYLKKKINPSSKIVLHLHNDYLNNKHKYNKFILSCCDEVWAVSNFIKQQVDDIGLDVTTRVLDNPLDTKVFEKKFTIEEKIELKRMYEISEKDFVFIYTGRLIQVKGVEELVLAFNRLCDKYSNIKLLVVGGSSNYTNESEYIKNLKSIANKNVIFVGYVPVIDLYKYYSIANAQVVPSLWNEAFGLILLEGMFFKLPIIASNSGGMPEICGEYAYYVERDNIVEELINKMEFVLNNSQSNAEKISFYDNILSKYTLTNYCNNFNNYLYDCVGDFDED